MNTKKMMITALCMALGTVLPMAFHTVPNAGSILLPMHIPTLLCGLATGPVYGLISGVLTPVLSFFVTGMPKVPYLFPMMFELGAYGLISGALSRNMNTRHSVSGLYCTLICAMIAGRFVYGAANALFFQSGSYTFELWLSASFVTAAPGIVLQLLLIPPVVLSLRKSGLIE